MTRLIDADALTNTLQTDLENTDQEGQDILNWLLVIIRKEPTATDTDIYLAAYEKAKKTVITESEKSLQTICNIQMETINAYHKIHEILREDNKALNAKVKLLEAELNALRG